MEEQGWGFLKQKMREVETGKISAETAAEQVYQYGQDVANRYDIGKDNVAIRWWEMIVGGLTDYLKSKK